MEISYGEKKQIAKDLCTYVEIQGEGSANKASKMLSGVSNGTISNVINEKWQNIAYTMWQNIKNQVCKKGEWVYVDIRPTLFINTILKDAAENSSTKGIVGIAGGCKTQTVKNSTLDNLFVVHCHEYFTSRDFVEELAESMGLHLNSGRISKMIKEIVKHVLKLKNPIIIIDEADKLHDKVLYFFISLYNALEGKCGIIIQATHYLSKRIKDGVDSGKKGFQEIYSRIGQIFLTVPKINLDDCTKICNANGVTDALVITGIFNGCNHDVRVVKYDVHAHLKAA